LQYVVLSQSCTSFDISHLCKTSMVSTHCNINKLVVLGHFVALQHDSISRKSWFHGEEAKFLLYDMSDRFKTTKLRWRKSNSSDVPTCFTSTNLWKMWYNDKHMLSLNFKVFCNATYFIFTKFESWQNYDIRMHQPLAFKTFLLVIKFEDVTCCIVSIFGEVW